MISTPKVPPPPPLSPRRERVHPRHPLRMSAEVLAANSQFTACTHDCSLGGARLELDRSLTEGTILGLLLFLVVDDIEDEMAEPIRIRAEVIWCTEVEPTQPVAGSPVPLHPTPRFHAGVRFIDPPTVENTWLSQLLDSTGSPGSKDS